MANPGDVEKLRQRLSIGGGTRVTGWLATAFDYFQNVCGANPLDDTHFKYLRGIDFHREVTTETLRTGTLLVRFPEIKDGVIQPERAKPYRFFATAGATPAHLGWNPREAGFQLFQLTQPVRALVSFASDIRFDRRDTRNRPGGDRQIVIPWHAQLTLLRARDFDRQKLAETLRAGRVTPRS